VIDRKDDPFFEDKSAIKKEVEMDEAEQPVLDYSSFVPPQFMPRMNAMAAYELRFHEGWTDKEIARKLHVSPSEVSNLVELGAASARVALDEFVADQENKTQVPTVISQAKKGHVPELRCTSCKELVDRFPIEGRTMCADCLLQRPRMPKRLFDGLE